MSKLKNITSSSSSVPAHGAPPSALSASDAGLFSEIFDSAAVAGAESQNAATGGGQEKKSDSNQGGVSEGQSETKADETERAQKSSQETKSDEEKMSAEEKREIDEMEAHRISMAELAEQLNVVLNVPAAQNAAQQSAASQAQNPFANVKVVFKGDGNELKNAVQEIDPKLLRKIDVELLDKQIRKLTANEDLLAVEVPAEAGAELPPETGLVAEDWLTQAGLANLADAQKQAFLAGLASDETIQHFGDDFSASKSLVAELTGRREAPTIPSHLEELHLQPGQAPLAVGQVAAGAKIQDPLTASKQGGKLGAPDLVKINLKVENVIMGSAKRGESDTTRIQMHPETLGRIEIKIEVKGKAVRAEIVTDNAEARESIVAHMPQIRAVLASENMMLDYFNARHDQGHFQQHPGEARSDVGADHQAFGGHGTGPKDGHSQSETALELKEAIRQKMASNTMVNLTV